MIGTIDACTDFAGIELAARAAATNLAARAVERRLNDNHADYCGPTLPCACGDTAHFEGRQAKSFLTVLGEITLQRAYYRCSHCKSGRFPRDAAFGFVNGSLSPALTRMLGLAAANVSFDEAAGLLRELAGITVTTKQVERHAEAVGREIAVDERQPPQPATPASDTMFLSMDGTGVPMRPTETVGRAGKQPDGSAKTREGKVVAIWTADARDADGEPIRDPGSVTYSAAIESAACRDTARTLSPFEQRVVREALRRGFPQAKRRVVIGDGALWIWRIADELFPGAIQIVDRYHVKENIARSAVAIYGQESAVGKSWRDERFEELDNGQLDNLIAALNIHSRTVEMARHCSDYIVNNRARLDYPRFKAMGLCTSSGVIEAGCKVVVGARLKRAGMHWTVSGAHAILALRCSVRSNRYADFWAQRNQRLQAA